MSKHNPRALTREDLKRLSPAAQAQLVVQLSNQAAPRETKKLVKSMIKPAMMPRSDRAGMWPRRHAVASPSPWPSLYVTMLIVLLIICWRLLVGMSY